MSDKVTDACCGREKYWSELNESEKLERMHHVVRQLRQMIEEQRHLLAMLQKHNHFDGKLVVPMESAEDRDSPLIRYHNNEYF